MEAKTQVQDTRTNHFAIDLFGIIVLSAIVLGCMAVLLPLQTQFEAKYLQIIQNFNSPNGNITYPLYYWVADAVNQLFHGKLIALRAISTVCALINLALLYWVMRAMFTRGIAVVSSIILASCLLFAGSAVFAGPQQFSFLLFSIVLYMTIYLCFSQDKKAKSANLVFWFVLGLIALTSGVYLVAFILVMLLIWLTIMQNKMLTAKFHSILGYLIFLVISLPWFIYASRHIDNFWYNSFILPFVQNFVALKANGFIPYWQHILGLLLAFMPWSIFLVNGLWYNAPSSWSERQSETIGMLLLLQTAGFALMLLLVNVSAVWSILPLSALAIICGRYLAPGLELKKLPLQRSAYEFLFILFIIILAYGITHLLFVYNRGDIVSGRLFSFLVGYIILSAVIILPILRYASIKKGFVALVLLCVITYIGGAVAIELNASSHQLLSMLNPDGNKHFLIMQGLVHAPHLLSR